MAREDGHANDAKGSLTDRRGYMKLVAGGLVGTSFLSSSIVDNAAAATVNLGAQGLSTGDVIDDYLDEHLASGNEVHVPAGTYEWNGNGLDGTYDDATLVGDGDVTFDFTGQYWNVNVFANGGGDVTFRNLTFRGPVTSNGNKSRFRFDARHPDSTVTLDNVNLPDGDSGGGRAIGIYIGKDHEGLIHLDNCHIEGFPNNGFYGGSYGSSGGGGGRVIVENSFFKNNNVESVRLGGDGDTIRNCVIVQNDIPALYTGARTGRGIRIRYPGDDITVENVHITSNAGVPFIVPDRAGNPSGTVTDLYIENDTGSTAAIVESGSFTAENVNVTGSGNRNVTGFDSASNVVSGSNADSPETSLSALGVGDDSSGDSSGDDEQSNQSGSDSEADDGPDEPSFEHTITIDGSTGDEKAYHLEVSGEVAPDSNVNPDDTVNTSSVDGTMYSSSDSYGFSGELVAFESDALDAMTVYVDGSRIDPTTIGQLSNEITVSGSTREPKAYSFSVSGDLEGGSNLNPDDSVDESSADSTVWASADDYRFSGELTDLEVESPEDVTVTVNGSAVDPDAIGDRPLPNRLVVDGTTNNGSATYSFTVSEAVEGSAELGSLEDHDEIDGTSVSGELYNGVDGFRFAGQIESFDVDGPAVVTIEQSRD